MKHLSIVPAIVHIGDQQIACLEWAGQFDRQLLTAIGSDREIFTAAISGVASTPYGILPYLLFFLGDYSQVERDPGNLFCFDLCLNPLEVGQSSIKLQWFSLLKEQRVLTLKVSASRGMAKLQPLVSGARLRRYISSVTTQMGVWLLRSQEYEKVTAAASEQITDTAYRYVEFLFRQYSCERTPEEKLVLVAYNPILEEFPLEHPLYQLANRHSLEALGEGLMEHYKNWQSLTALEQHAFLVADPVDSVEGIFKAWVFACHCLVLSKKYYPSGAIAVAKGCTADGRWLMHLLEGKRVLATLFAEAGLYRYLLVEDWGNLIEPRDEPCGDMGLNTIYAAGKIPDRETFGYSGKILQSALAHQHYGISPLTTIVVCFPGCEEIVFLPLGQGNRHCLFKIVVQSRRDKQNSRSCLWGRLDAFLGTLTFARPLDPTVSECLKLYGFLVAIAYRDLVVCEEVLSKETEATTKQSKRGKKRQKSTIPTIARKRYKVDLSTDALSPSFGDPQRVVKQVRLLLPHLRTFHPRQLPEGYRASATQRELAAQYQIELADGETFVRETLVKGGRDDNEIRTFRSLSLLRLFFG